MIKTENLGNRNRHYSDVEYKIKQIETSTLYNDAVDVLSCKYIYEETDEPIDEEPLETDKIINISLEGEIK